MNRTFRMALGLAAALGVAALLAGLALQQWLASTDFRERAQAAAQQSLGVPVALGGMAVTFWPLPAVALEDVAVKTQPPLTLARVQARPAWGALLAGRLEVATLVVRDAVLPQRGIDGLLDALQKKERTAPAGQGLPPQKAEKGSSFPRRMVLDGVTWIDPAGRRSTVEAQARIDDDGLPGDLTLKVREGRLEGTRLSLRRAAGAGRDWAVEAFVGGGTVRGTMTLAPVARDAMLNLRGSLETSDVEVAILTAPASGAPAPLSGKLDASTTLQARAAQASDLLEALRTQTRFTVRAAVVHGIDLAKAVKTIGLSRGGQTRLDTLAGQVSTQGRAIQLSGLVASSGALTASGNVAVSPRRELSGHVAVNLAERAVGRAVGVPLVVGGTLDAPEVTLTRGALLGAAIGTAVLPGVGTGAGARLGDELGRGLKGLFGR
ncbi:MAG: hypothetical protein KF740_15210 [Ramlibacter sp.]|nr:hypothetical protein [Ramlibacter sp.]